MAAINGFLKGAQLASKGALVLIDAIGVKDLVQLGAYLAQQAIDAGMKEHSKRIEEKKNLVKIPDIFSSNYCLKLEDAKRWLEEDGFRVAAVVVKPDVKFKDCVEFEVVATNYRANQEVKRKERIILQYVTSEVIEASQRLFDAVERQKTDIKHKKSEEQEKKANERAKQIANTKRKIDDTVTHVQHSFNDVAAITQKSVEGIVSNFANKKGLKNTPNMVDGVINNDDVNG